MTPRRGLSRWQLPWWCVVEHPEVNGAGKVCLALVATSRRSFFFTPGSEARSYRDGMALSLPQGSLDQVPRYSTPGTPCFRLTAIVLRGRLLFSGHWQRYAIPDADQGSNSTG
eukprot:752506-Hanusia_phi.AAC.2